MTAISSIVNDIFRSYDRNGDNCIAIRPGQGFEGTYTQRDFQPGYDQDTITVTRYSYDSLFKAADKDNDGLVCRQELADAIKLFDKNNDGKLENHGPFWNRKGEYRDFEKAHPERAELLDHQVIYHPQPHIPNPGYPHNYPGGYPGSYPGGYPGNPNYPHFHQAQGLAVGVSIGA